MGIARSIQVSINWNILLGMGGWLGTESWKIPRFVTRTKLMNPMLKLYPAG